MKNKYKNIVLFILVVSFVLITYLVKVDKIIDFDNYVYNFLNDHINDNLTTFFRLITYLANWQTIVILCIGSLIVFKNKWIGIIISINSIFNAILNNILKCIFVRPRPDVLKLIIQDGYSYPSGHTMASMSFYGLFIYLIYKSKLNIKLKIILITLLSLLIILIGISRIYLGVHYSSDVIAGYIISVIYLIIFISIVNKLKESK